MAKNSPLWSNTKQMPGHEGCHGVLWSACSASARRCSVASGWACESSHWWRNRCSMKRTEQSEHSTKIQQSQQIVLDPSWYLRAVYLWCDLSNDVQGLLEQAVVWNPLKSTLHMHGTTWNQLESARKNLSTFVDDLAFTVSLLRLANLPKQGNQKLNDLRE